MKFYLKKFSFLLIFTLLFFYCFGNPFFNSGFTGNQPFPENGNSEEISNQNEFSENNLQNQEIQKSGPSPVLVGKTNEKLTVFQGDLREEIASFFRNWKNAEGIEKSKILLENTDNKRVWRIYGF